VGGRRAEHRLAIHHRHYEASLVSVLLDKFPAATWLVGSEFITAAARHFVATRPPCTPCIAEYAQDFPEFLAARPGADRAPYLREFGELEWHFGHVAIAVAERPLPMDDITAVAAEVLPNAALTLQSGVRYLRASWPVDELMKVYLAEMRPDHLEFEPAEVRLEIRGARGEVRINRLEPAEFIFRNSVMKGRVIGDAAELALDADARFDPGAALAVLLTSGLVTAIAQNAQGEER
jgi:hypothetical protein